MDDLNNKTDASNSLNQNFESTFLTTEHILYSNDKSASEKSTAWRQQYLLINTFSDTNCCDLLERQCDRHNAFIDNGTVCKHLNNIRSLIGSDFKFHTDIKFPNIDEISFKISEEKNHVVPGSELPDQGHQLVIKPSGIEMRTFTGDDGNATKTRNTIQQFLQRPTVKNTPATFSSARELLAVQTMKVNYTKLTNKSKNMQSNGFGCQRNGNGNEKIQDAGFNFGATKKSLGLLGRVNSNRKSFVSPVRSICTTTKDIEPMKEDKIDMEVESLLSHPALKNVDGKMVELINNEIIHTYEPVDWNEIAGLDYAKSIIKEAVVYPLLRPDIFTGLRRPPRGILLFGPPGTGKTLIGKCIASQSSSTFFSISSASLTSKWMGEGEKMVRALFAVAVARQPSVIFIDEIDSLLSQRSESENEGTRRLKTEFLVRLDGAATSNDDRVLIVGATNRPQELDEAVRRRFVKRLYVPLPEMDARTEILTNLLKSVDNNLNTNELKEISKLADGYSGADMDSLCREASMEPLRSLPAELIITFNKENLRPVNINDFHSALKKIRPSVSQKDLNQYVDWNKTFGSSY